MWLYVMVEDFKYIGNNSISSHVTSGLTTYSVLRMHIFFCNDVGRHGLYFIIIIMRFICIAPESIVLLSGALHKCIIRS